ncbi:MAG: hypothetical protein U1G05_14335 [Kiritimatiellia bacterium]
MELAGIRALVQGKPLSEVEKQEILTTLRHLLATPGSTLEKNQAASAILHSLADVAMIDRAQIPAMLAVLRGEPRPSAPVPPETVPPASPRRRAAGRGGARRSAVRGLDRRSRRPARPVGAARAAASVETPPPLPKPKAPAGRSGRRRAALK